jgi:hypothetical protein
MALVDELPPITWRRPPLRLAWNDLATAEDRMELNTGRPLPALRRGRPTRSQRCGDSAHSPESAAPISRPAGPPAPRP